MLVKDTSIDYFVLKQKMLVLKQCSVQERLSYGTGEGIFDIPSKKVED